MSVLRNPFRILASENMPSIDTFLRLFGQSALEIVSNENMWNKVNIIQSTPGGGKTTLFKLFTPQSLLNLYIHRADDEFKILYKKLDELKVISEEGVNLLGIMISCKKDYHQIEDLEINKSQKERLFISLLNSRIIIALLRSILELNELNYPEDLKKILIEQPAFQYVIPNLTFPSNGEIVYNWARNLELSVISSMDSFAPLQASNLIYQGNLFSLELLNPSYIKIEENRISQKILLMIDDLHQLRRSQRTFLLDTILTSRLPIIIWIAERLESLPSSELLSSGVSYGREFYPPIRLEQYWRGQGKLTKFEFLLSEIANKRSSLASDFPISKFDSCLDSSLDGPEWSKNFQEILSRISSRVKKKGEQNKSYDPWIREIDSKSGTSREKILAWLSLEIMMNRRQPLQKNLFGEPLGPENKDLQLESDIKAASEIFLYKEFSIPYYYGFQNLVKISSSNIEQFLLLAGNLFEESISSRWLGKSNLITPSRQQEILRDAAKKYLYSTQSSISNASEVQKFINLLGDFCTTQSYRPNAPYSPGVTGIGITMESITKMLNEKENIKFKRISNILSACISNNLLEAYPNYKQGKKGQLWLILYLNRLLCVHFGLPLNYGGWRSRTLKDLELWIDK